MTEKRIPKIRVGDHWIPAHRVWNVVETITTAADLVEKFNEERPTLSTAMTREVVATVRGRIRDMELSMGGEGALKAAALEAGVIGADQPTPAGLGGGDNQAASGAGGGRGSTEVAAPTAQDKALNREALADAARQLLDAMSLEDALRMLENDYHEPVDIRDVIKMVGRDAYLGNLAREAKELLANMIVPEQIAELWNESKYPSPIGGLWTKGDVETLLG